MRTVVLRHDLPDGTHHYDWLIEPAGVSGGERVARDPDERVLVTWRLGARLSEVLGGGFDATRLPPHRRVYLDSEGEVSGGRGRVTRVESGEAKVRLDGAERCEIEVSVGSVTAVVVGRRVRGDAWRFERA